MNESTTPAHLPFGVMVDGRRFGFPDAWEALAFIESCENSGLAPYVTEQATRDAIEDIA